MCTFCSARNIIGHGYPALELRSDVLSGVIVYFLHHTEQDKNTGKITAKTVGKMLSDVLTVEGCFDIVLWAKLEGQEHVFQTQTDGYCTCKSPEGMFEKIIPNDLKAVDTRIREYYGYLPKGGE